MLCFPYVGYCCPLTCPYHSLNIALLSDTKRFSRLYPWNLTFLQGVLVSFGSQSYLEVSLPKGSSLFLKNVFWLQL